jgi:hypothetical protein
MHSRFTPTCFSKSWPSSGVVVTSEATQAMPVLWVYMDYGLSSVVSYRGKSLPSSGGHSYLRSYSSNVCIVDVYGLRSVQCGQLSRDVTNSVQCDLIIWEKVNQSRYRSNWPRWWIEVQLYPFLTSALEGGGWSASRPSRFTPGKDPVPIAHEAGWVPGSLWTCAKNFAPTEIRSPDRPACSQSLYRLSYPAHCNIIILIIIVW